MYIYTYWRWIWILLVYDLLVIHIIVVFVIWNKCFKVFRKSVVPRKVTIWNWIPHWVFLREFSSVHFVGSRIRSRTLKIAADDDCIFETEIQKMTVLRTDSDDRTRVILIYLFTSLSLPKLVCIINYDGLFILLLFIHDLLVMYYLLWYLCDWDPEIVYWAVR